MARKGQKRGLKRSKAPKRWSISRKEKKWTINVHPGPHDKEAIPLAFILRDYLEYALTLREARRILNERKVRINGTVRTDFKYPIGIMDVIEIPVTGESYRMLPDWKGNLIMHPIRGEETHFRPLKIVGKHLVKRGAIQLHFHDGTTLQVGKEVKYTCNGTILYDFESRTIRDYFPFTKGNYAVITSGRNVFRTGNITVVERDMVEIRGEESYKTLKSNVFVIGTKESAISLPGG
jgi:small subunit ribosomal protein S4e